MCLNHYRTAALAIASAVVFLTGCGPNAAERDGHASVTPTNAPAVTAPSRRRAKREIAPASVPEATEAATPESTTGEAVPILPGAANPEAKVDSRQLVARLTQAGLNNGTISAEQAAEISRLLQQLNEQGEAALPAIRDFLQRNEDVVFQGVPGGEAVGYGSLRLGLINALTQIGGDKATAIAAQTLQSAADPMEIALLASMLEQTAPKQYRAQAMAAASEALTQALNGRLPSRDVSPLFETLQAVGDASVVPLLKQSVGQWNYYGTIALAGLADGAGIPTLIGLAADPDVSAMGNGDIALRPLAQVAVQYPAAAKALVDDARAGGIPDTAWPTVISSLAGTSIEYGNGYFGPTAPKVTWSVPEINQRISILQQLLDVTRDPQTRQALQGAIAGLNGRLPK